MDRPRETPQGFSNLQLLDKDSQAMLSTKIFSVLTALLLTSLPFYCVGQTRPKLNGRVLDQNREAIRGAQVIVAPEDSGYPSSTVTNETGEFSIEVSTQNCR